MGQARTRQGESKKSKPVFTLPPLRGGQNPSRTKRGRVNQTGQDKIAISSDGSYIYLFTF